MSKTIFLTSKKESLESKIKRIAFNFFPAYRRTGARICFASSDWKEVHVKHSLNWKTRNYVGTVFGGSIYGALDPVYMIQLIKILGSKYIVWDKSAVIKFIKPIRNTVFAKFFISDEDIEKIISRVKAEHKFLIDFTARFQDKNGIVYAEVIKTIYIAEKI